MLRSSATCPATTSAFKIARNLSIPSYTIASQLVLHQPTATREPRVLQPIAVVAGASCPVTNVCAAHSSNFARKAGTGPGSLSYSSPYAACTWSKKSPSSHPRAPSAPCKPQNSIRALDIALPGLVKESSSSSSPASSSCCSIKSRRHCSSPASFAIFSAISSSHSIPVMRKHRISSSCALSVLSRARISCWTIAMSSDARSRAI